MLIRMLSGRGSSGRMSGLRGRDLDKGVRMQVRVDLFDLIAVGLVVLLVLFFFVATGIDKWRNR